MSETEVKEQQVIVGPMALEVVKRVDGQINPISYLAKVLPEMDRLTISVSPKLDRENIDMGTAIPMYREMDNGHFANVLEDLMNQENPEKMVAVLGINNTPDNEKARTENALMFECVRFINGEREQLPKGLDKRTRDMCRKCQDSKVNLVAIDMFSKGYPRDMARIRTLITAFGSYYCGCESGAVVSWLDGDTRMQKDYAADLRAVSRMGADYLPQRIDYYAEGTQVLESGFQYRFDIYRADLLSLLKLRTPRYLHGPCIAADRDLFTKALNNYVETDYMRASGQVEDFVMSDLLANMAKKITYMGSKTIETADRMREDGFDSKLRMETIGKDESEAETINIQFLNSLIENTAGNERIIRYGQISEMLQKSGVEVDEDEILRILRVTDDAHEIYSMDTINGEYPLSSQLVKDALEKYMEEKGCRMCKPLEWVRNVEALFKQNFSEFEKDVLGIRLVDANIRESNYMKMWKDQVSAYIREMGELSDELLPLASEIDKLGSNEEVLDYLKVKYPGYFDGSEQGRQSETRRAVFEMQALLETVYFLEDRPEDQKTGLRSIQVVMS